ncbi:hypothetical protein [Verrucomicrobium spinosum]|uniref:hypothetical protein n=1 Tax=Verrucomicrobium spinosum TaxID=2736 RepID=UPI00155DD7CE|nr:hypothetical protein [Verrucomicrobium spinosum]
MDEKWDGRPGTLLKGKTGENVIGWRPNEGGMTDSGMVAEQRHDLAVRKLKTAQKSKPWSVNTNGAGLQRGCPRRSTGCIAGSVERDLPALRHEFVRENHGEHFGSVCRFE